MNAGSKSDQKLKWREGKVNLQKESKVKKILKALNDTNELLKKKTTEDYPIRQM